MIEKLVKERVEKEYSLRIQSIEKIKNVYKITTDEDKYCLKVINYEFSHFLFIISAIKHLQERGFEQTPDIIRTESCKDYISLSNKYAYLTPWLDARVCNYNNPLDVQLASYKLAELHKKSCGFKVNLQMKPRVGWFRWVDNFRNKRNELLLFKKIIKDKETITEFDDFYLRCINEELKRINVATDDLVKSDYFNSMESEILDGGFCHHDYAHHNILIGKDNQVNIIDFDYCILDTHLHDLSSLLIRVMKNGKWDIKNSIFIIDCYNSIYSIKKDDVSIMAAFIEFPQAFWQLGIQYYIEKQPWKEEFFMNKLRKIYDDKDLRQEFVNEFKNIKYY
ncbi:CotS family spore coat protein [Clostridium tetanomorphum]|uniref:CotS family spore coat protein n=1 Tax=Clostridium tetanomorphum TaxID=1553 RepID=UPI000445EB8F|nr:CotS family spore coat protein [Clostridium tetanomorphum]KAJ53303.1 spore coat protein [Clostridium tetanomorphum DSM 665]MBP1865665.1 CotS family spore coat protein [Clostridium tetanomorphum]NRS86785.1 CotS family spore coat protein [Clostridium tetanomorphum]SQC00422.1 spore coat protein [Clostridium tetanomorphum]